MYRGTKCVLFVDDNSNITKHHISYLQERGMHVLHARNMEEAIEIANTKKDNIDIVVLDMMFNLSAEEIGALTDEERVLANSGKFYGLVVHGRLKAISEKFKYMILSVRKDVKEKAVKVGISDILGKPVRPLHLYEFILRVLE